MEFIIFNILNLRFILQFYHLRSKVMLSKYLLSAFKVACINEEAYFEVEESLRFMLQIERFIYGKNSVRHMKI